MLFRSIYLSAFPIAAIGFAYGISFLMLASLAGALVLTVVNSLEMAFAFLLVDFMPVLLAVGLFTWGFKRNLKEQPKGFNYGFILAVLCLLMSFFMVIGARIMVMGSDMFSLDETQANQVIAFRDIIHILVEQVISKTVADMPVDINDVTKVLVPVVPAIFVIMWLFHIIIGLVVAIWTADKLGKAIRKKPDYKNMILPYWFIAALLVMTALSFVLKDDNGYLAQNVAIVFLMPFVLQGFTVVHMFAQKTKYPKIAVFLFYSFFVVGSYKVVLAIGILGLIESFIKLRHKEVANNLEE